MLSSFFVLQLVTTLLSIQVPLFVHSGWTNDGNDLAALCAGKRIDLTAHSELSSLVSKLYKKDKPPCSDFLERALKDMKRLYDGSTLNICTMSKVQHIKDYIDMYLNAQGEKLPKSLEDFVIAYGMQVSNYCKVDMIRVFMDKEPVSNKISDFAELEEYAGEETPIGRLMEAINEPGDIVQPIDLMAVLPNKTMFEKIFVKMPGNLNLRIPRIKEVCAKRFRPIYEPVVMPLAALSRAGFDYPDAVLRVDLEETPELVKGVAAWSRVIFLCEAVELIEIIPTPPEDSDDDDDDDEQDPEFRFLSNDEVEDLAATPQLEYNSMVGFDPIEYTHDSTVQVGNIIITSYDKKLKTLMKAYKAHESETERVRDKFVKKSWSLLRNRLKYGEYMKTVKLVYKRLKENNEKAANRNQEESTYESDSEKLDNELERVNRELIDLMDDKKKTKTYRILSYFNRTVKRTSRLVVAFLIATILYITNIPGKLL